MLTDSITAIIVVSFLGTVVIVRDIVITKADSVLSKASLFVSKSCLMLNVKTLV